MRGEPIEIRAADGVADAYLVRPGGPPRAGVLLVMDAFGLRPVIEDLAERIAAGGYVVLAPNVLYRAGRSPLVDPETLGDPEARAAAFGRLRPPLAALTRETVAADGVGYLDALTEAGAQGPVGVTGYCMGGRVGWWLAVSHPDRVAALGAFHTGGLVADGADSPHRAAAEVRAELYFGFADDDPGMTAEHVETLRRALDNGGARYTAEVYEGARHGYAMADLPVFDEAARERHFRALQALLARTVG
jgi:carboxymethylenebutenolidase